MPASLTPQSLEKFECKPDKLYDCLSDPARGIALCEVPGNLDPQGLVERFADMLTIPDLRQGLSSGTGCINYSDPSQRRYYGENERAMRDFDDDFIKLRHTLQTLMQPLTSRILSSLCLFRSSTQRSAQATHEDDALITVWLGMTQPGLEITPSDESPLSISCLPHGYILATRQANWEKLHRGITAPGIEHALDWTSQGTDTQRVVGLDFFYTKA